MTLHLGIDLILQIGMLYLRDVILESVILALLSGCFKNDRKEIAYSQS